jgi:hypothetical protein
MSNPDTPADEPEPLMDRRLGVDRRSGSDRRRGQGAKPEGVAKDRRATSDRRKGDRRKTRAPRNINQYDMDPDVLEFVNAVARFREMSGNRFPQAKDILQILKDLGYEKQGGR